MTDGDGCSGAGTVVVGVGSPLMGDDGLGVAVVERLRETWDGVPGLELLDGGVWGMQLMPFIEGARRLLLIDVIRSGARPGTVVRLEADELPRHLHHKLSPHQIDLGEVFALLELRGSFPPEAVALGVEPHTVELVDGLSPCVEAAVSELIEQVERQLARWGHEPARREAMADA